MNDGIIQFLLPTLTLFDIIANSQPSTQASMRLSTSAESEEYVTIQLYQSNALKFYTCMNSSDTCTLYLSHLVNTTYTASAVKSESAFKPYCPAYVCRFKQLLPFESFSGSSYTHKVLCELKNTDHVCTCGNTSFLIDWQNQEEYFRNRNESFKFENKTFCSPYKTADDNNFVVVGILVFAACVVSLVLIVICLVRYRNYINDMKKKVVQDKSKNIEIDFVESGKESPSPNEYSGVKVNKVYSCLRAEAKNFQHDYELLPLPDVQKSQSVVDDCVLKSSLNSVDITESESTIQITPLTSGTTGVYSLAKVL
ncbi:hypothetical protein Bpfe_026713 [Biomphalaria pfeifferi]|uniref:Uncharacterized protein n=1 Tax=Biomphalaria pfeifferi TaxID=112525 RepID=A0AAD8AWR1_BIOPF|nr:hypothetical protein Bpfe_026713 [Biomphalaria pfeifferi]